MPMNTANGKMTGSAIRTAAMSSIRFQRGRPMFSVLFMSLPGSVPLFARLRTCSFEGFLKRI